MRDRIAPAFIIYLFYLFISFLYGPHVTRSFITVNTHGQ